MGFIVLNVNNISNKRLLIGGLLILLSLFSKETGILFLVITGLFHFLYRRLTVFKIIWTDALVLGVYIMMRFFMANVSFTKLAYVPIVKLSLVQRLYTVPEIIFYYIKTFFYPKDLTISQHWVVNSPSVTMFYMPLFLDILFLFILISFGIYCWKYSKESLKPYLFFTLWFLLGIGLHMQIFPLDMTVAERWFYFSIVGLLGIIGVFLNCMTSIKYKKVMAVLSIVVLSILSLRTVRRTFDWKNAMTLYLHDIQHNDSSFDLESNAGAELFRAGRKEEAKRHFEKSVVLAPEHWVNSANLAGYYYDAKDFVNAEKYYEISIKNGPNFQPSYENYGRLLVYYDTSNGKRAKEFLDKSVKRFPKNGKLWLYLTIANYQQSLAGEALIAAEQAYILEPNNNSKYVYFRLKQNLPLEINIK